MAKHERKSKKNNSHEKLIEGLTQLIIQIIAGVVTGIILKHLF